MSGALPPVALSKLPPGSAPGAVDTSVVAVQWPQGTPTDVLVPTSSLTAANIVQASPASGSTLAVPAGTDVLVVGGSGALAALTLSLPPSPARLLVVFAVAVTALSFAAPSGVTVAANAPTAATAGAFLHGVLAGSTWYLG